MLGLVGGVSCLRQPRGSTALWDDLALELAEACPLMGGLVALLEKPDIYNGLYLLGKNADSWSRKNQLCKVFH